MLLCDMGVRADGRFAGYDPEGRCVALRKIAAKGLAPATNAG
jgi:hypothetical protein